jgi:hypothetical protein
VHRHTDYTPDCILAVAGNFAEADIDSESKIVIPGTPTACRPDSSTFPAVVGTAPAVLGDTGFAVDTGFEADTVVAAVLQQGTQAAERTRRSKMVCRPLFW